MARYLLHLLSVGFIAGLSLGPPLLASMFPNPLKVHRTLGTTSYLIYPLLQPPPPVERSLQAIVQPALEIDLSDRQVRLYKGDVQLKSYPIAIGRQGWETPTGEFMVMDMRRSPTWIHPITNESIPGGDPDNPLGPYWVGFWTDGWNWVGFHGTPERETVGGAASHGCIRMYNEDIAELFYQVKPGTPVRVVQ